MPASNSLPGSPTRRKWAAVFGLVAIMLILPGSCAMDPLLYSSRDASTTGFHQDLAATGGQSRADAELVLKEWSTNLNLTAPLVHNIRLREFKAAGGDLEQFLFSEQNLKDLVFRLDMTDTDAATFRNDSHANTLSLRGLLDQAKGFYGLQDAEDTFRDQKNLSGLKSVELQGETLRTEIRKNYHDYAGRSDRVTSVSQRFGLDTSAFEASVKEFAAILAEVEAIQDRRSASITETIREIQCPGGICEAPSAISLDIKPDHGAYGDTLSMTGTVQAPAGTAVRVFVDGRQSGSTMTDQEARFSFPYRIDQVAAETHTAYASVDSAISDVSNFTVDRRNTTISLTAHVVKENGTVKGIGTGRLVTGDGVPVRSARVSLDVDSRSSWGEAITGDDGVFAITAEQLSPKNHTLKARFDPGGFPLNGSESAPVTVVAPSGIDWFASIIYLFGIGGAAVGAVLFLRTRQGKDVPPSAQADEISPPDSVEPSPVPTLEEAYLIADRATIPGGDGVNRYESIGQIYRQLVREMEGNNPDLRLRWRTPRDLARMFADQPYGDQLALLVEIHEKVRYADHEATEEDLERMREAFISIITEGGGH